ncbi:hypothetical protein EV424DRAFT_1559022 [Suillus variegatus]|nr:hypothetical protein EV424DRAFT_1559022 [Suillus variegatus]
MYQLAGHEKINWKDSDVSEKRGQTESRDIQDTLIHLSQVEHMPWRDTSPCKGERSYCQEVYRRILYVHEWYSPIYSDAHSVPTPDSLWLIIHNRYVDQIECWLPSALIPSTIREAATIIVLDYSAFLPYKWKGSELVESAVDYYLKSPMVAAVEKVAKEICGQGYHGEELGKKVIEFILDNCLFSTPTSFIYQVKQIVIEFTGVESIVHDIFRSQWS